MPLAAHAQCWDENDTQHGVVIKHCDHRTTDGGTAPNAPSVQGPPEPSPGIPAVPPSVYGYGYNPYVPAYVDAYGTAHYPPPPGYYPGYADYPAAGYYGYPHPIPGPLAVFRFGPFTFVIP